jgi:putative glutamine amidotransferase
MTEIKAIRIHSETDHIDRYVFDNDVINSDDLPLLSIRIPRDPNASIVAIPLDFDDEYGYHTKYFVADVMIQNGLYPVFLSHDKYLEQLEYWKPSGIFLPGGVFFIPHDWLHPDVQGPFQPRDMSHNQVYVGALEYSIKNKLPLIAVCAGMQTVGAYLGGRIGFMPIMQPESTNIHKSAVLNKDAMHDITIDKNSILYKTIGTENLHVNSRHKAMLYQFESQQFSVVAKSPDGITEAIELKDPWASFIGLYQWHAEEHALLSTSRPECKLFNQFADAVNKI